MTTEQMKKEYEANQDLVRYGFPTKTTNKRFVKIGRGDKNWHNYWTYKLILKEHEHISDAVIANPDVEVEFMDSEALKYFISVDKGAFFNGYQPCFDYRLAKAKCDGRWNGYYIEASKEAYDKLVELGYEDDYNYEYYVNDDRQFIGIIDNEICGYKRNPSLKPFYLVDGKFAETKGEKDETDTISTNTNINTNNDANVNVTTISIKDKQGKEYSLQDFEKDIHNLYDGDFRIDITTMFKDKSVHLDFYYGIKFESTSTQIDDALRAVLKQVEGYLTPIKPKWYEDENNFPALIVYEEEPLRISVTTKIEDDKFYDSLDFIGHQYQCRLATKEELMSLHYLDKE